MKTIDEVLQALLENRKLYVPFHVALQIIGKIESIELKERSKKNGRLQNSLRNHDET